VAALAGDARVIRVLAGDCREVLATLPADSVHCVVTSPPYWGLRDYGVAGQLGLEPSPDEYVASMVAVFREVRRVLRPDGVCWLNLGDSYSGGAGGRGNVIARADGTVGCASRKHDGTRIRRNSAALKPKDLVGIPWRVAFALQADGWWLRSDIIWAKPNPMPESVTDRPTKAHEYIFLLTKSARYFYDQEAVREPLSDVSLTQIRLSETTPASEEFRRKRPYGHVGNRKDGHGDCYSLVAKKGGASRGHSMNAAGRNLRSVWTIATAPFAEAHFATFPPQLAETCIKAGTSDKGCCPACGAPWVRVVDRVFRGNGHTHGDAYDLYQIVGRKMKLNGEQLAAAHRANPNTQQGFRPSCACAVATPVPCTVLDPFAGAGTALLVADRLQRHAIGIELNSDYVAMLRARIAGDRGPLFAAEVTA
jgi:DNA modification methylase